MLSDTTPTPADTLLAALSPEWPDATLREQIRALVDERPDLTLAELKARLATELCPATLCSALRKLKLTLKKKC